jgi:hypothetical protein
MESSIKFEVSGKPNICRREEWALVLEMARSHDPIWR